MKTVEDKPKGIPFWKEWHYRIAYVPSDKVEETSLELHQRARNLKEKDEIIEFMRSRFEKQKPFLETADYSGFYSSLSYFLNNRYMEFSGDTTSFIYCYYPLIVFHLFAPPHRMNEQAIGLPSSQKLVNLFSTLALITNDIIACYLYSHANRHGRRKYLRYFSAPFVSETFKGLEYLSKLYYLGIDNSHIGKTFKNFINQYAKMSDDLLDALWEFRCGLVHKGTLYNVRKQRIYRFGYSWNGIKKPPIEREKKAELRFLKGTKYQVNCYGLFFLFEAGKRFVFNDMMQNFPKYVLNKNFASWVQRHWTMQYLPTEEEMSLMCNGNNVSLEDIRQLFPNRTVSVSEVQIALCQVSKLRTFRLKKNRIIEDLQSRIRDLFAP